MMRLSAFPCVWMVCCCAATPCPDGSTPTRVTSSIQTSDDDAEEAVASATPDELAVGALYTTSSDIELGFDSDKYEGNQYVGLRFASVAVPPSVYVHAAHVAFTVDKVDGGCCNETFDVTVKMQKVGNAPSFVNQTNAYLRSIFASSSTSASVTYSPAMDSAVGASATTPDLSDLVQEVLGQSGWASGNAMAVVFGDATGNTEAHSREYESYDTDPAKAPQLIIDYCPLSCPDGSTPTVATSWVASSADDAEEAVAGASSGSVQVGELYTTSSDIELGYDKDKYTGNQYVALRFQGVAVPQGATVQDARVKFWVDNQGSCCDGDLSVTVKMQKSTNAAAFTGQANGYVKDTFATGATSASQTYSPAVDAAGDVHQPRYTPNLAALVQEVVDQSGWASGNAMAALFGDPTGSAEANSREYESYDTEPRLAPSIFVAYCGATTSTAPGGPGQASYASRAVASTLLGFLMVAHF